MQTVSLAQTNIATTRLGFGCAGLMRLPSREKRQDLLSTAFDSGIRHFDVARMYGLGAAERELGHFARSRRDRLVIATKFGIDPAPSSWMTRLQGPARALIARYPALRDAVRRREAKFHHPRRYDAEIARSSLERSLKELQTDYVDIFFLHDPRDEDSVEFEDLRTFLEVAREAGTIRSWGVAGEALTASRATECFSCNLVLQARDDIFRRPAASPAVGQMPQITFGVLSPGLAQILEHARSSDVVRRRWTEEIGLEVSATTAASLLLRDGLEANPDGVVLFSTTKGDRIRAAATVLDHLEEPALKAFQRLVADEFEHHGEPAGRA